MIKKKRTQQLPSDNMSEKRDSPPLHLSDQVHVPKKRKKFKPRFRRTKQEMEEGLTVEEAKEARSLANPDMSDDDEEMDEEQQERQRQKETSRQRSIRKIEEEKKLLKEQLTQEHAAQQQVLLTKFESVQQQPVVYKQIKRRKYKNKSGCKSFWFVISLFSGPCFSLFVSLSLSLTLSLTHSLLLFIIYQTKA